MVRSRPILAAVTANVLSRLSGCAMFGSRLFALISISETSLSIRAVVTLMPLAYRMSSIPQLSTTLLCRHGWIELVRLSSYVIVETFHAEAHPAMRRSTLVFCVNLAHVRDLTDAFRRAGVDARYLHAGTPALERNTLISAFRAGEFPVLLNCGKYATSHRGWHSRSHSCH